MARHDSERKPKAVEPEAERVRKCKSEWRLRSKKQLLNTAVPPGRPGGLAFDKWNPRHIRTKVNYLVRYYAGRPLAEWLSPDLLQKYFHPIQRGPLWDLFAREKKLPLTKFKCDMI